MGFNPQTHYEAGHTMNQELGSYVQENLAPQSSQANNAFITIESDVLSYAGQCLSAYQYLVQSGASKRYNPQYLQMLQNWGTLVNWTTRYKTVENDYWGSAQSKEVFTVVIEYVSAARDPFNVGYPPIEPSWGSDAQIMEDFKMPEEV